MISRKKLQLLALLVLALLLLQYLSSSGFGDRILPKVEYLHQEISKQLEYKSEISDHHNNAPQASEKDNNKKSEIKEEHKVKPEKSKQNHDKSERSDKPKDRSKISEQQHYNNTKISEEGNDTLNFKDSGNKTEKVRDNDNSPDNSAQYDEKDKINIKSDSGSMISEPYDENKSPEDLTEVQLPNVPSSNSDLVKSTLEKNTTSCFSYPDVLDIKFNNLYWQVLETEEDTYYLYGAYLGRFSKRMKC